LDLQQPKKTMPSLHLKNLWMVRSGKLLQSSQDQETPKSKSAMSSLIRIVKICRQFYRLTQTDYDGRFETFQVIGISLVQEQGVSGVYKIYPNPSSGRFTLQSENMNLEETALEIYDLNGSLVLKSSE